jgi:hypothetical protein
MHIALQLLLLRQFHIVSLCLPPKICRHGAHALPLQGALRGAAGSPGEVWCHAVSTPHRPRQVRHKQWMTFTAVAAALHAQSRQVVFVV